VFALSARANFSYWTWMRLSGKSAERRFPNRVGARRPDEPGDGGISTRNRRIAACPSAPPDCQFQDDLAPSRVESPVIATSFNGRPTLRCLAPTSERKQGCGMSDILGPKKVVPIILDGCGGWNIAGPTIRGASAVVGPNGKVEYTTGAANSGTTNLVTTAGRQLNTPSSRKPVLLYTTIRK